MACHSRHHVLLLSFVLAVCTLPSLVSAGVSFKSLGNATISIQGFKYNPETNTTSQLVNQTIKVKETILLRWTPLPTAAAMLPSFTSAHVKMCYGPASTVNRGWRKAIDDIALDRQCHRKIIDVVSGLFSGFLSHLVFRCHCEVCVAGSSDKIIDAVRGLFMIVLWLPLVIHSLLFV
jgi:hypothetical protein